MDTPRNILLYITDQFRADALGCYGNRAGVTPNFDQLATNGCRFENAYTVTAQCAPARASLMTGLYPSRHGISTNGPSLEPGLCGAHWLDDDLATAWLGHWHLGWERTRFGFDHNVYNRGGTDVAPESDDYRNWLLEKGVSPDGYPAYRADDFINGTGSSRLTAEMSLSSFLADQAIDLLETLARAQTPFFLVVSDFAPHPPFAAPPPYDTLVDAGEVVLPENLGAGDESACPRIYSEWRGNLRQEYDLSPPQLARIWSHYLGLCALADHNFGRLRKTLARLGLEDSTGVGFLSDHGEMLGSHGLLFKGPCFYREQMRVPLLMSGPGIPKGKVVEEPVSLIDVFPTLATWLRCQVPSGLDGCDLMPLIQSTGVWSRDAVFAEYERQFRKVDREWMRGRAVFTKRWKYHWTPDDVDELYDLRNDPGECRNLVADPAFAGVRNEMRARLNPTTAAAPTGPGPDCR